MVKDKNIVLSGSDGKPMLTDIFYKENNVQKPVIIYLHGFNGFKDWGNFDLIAKQFADAGFVFIKFNLSHGGTTVEEPDTFGALELYGNNNYTKQLFDLQVVINWVTQGAGGRSKEIDHTSIGLLGHSLGGGIVIIKAAEEKQVKALATWASVAACKTPWGNWDDDQMQKWKAEGVAYYMNGRTKQQMPLYYQLHENYLEYKARLDIKEAFASLDIPLLICHGKDDPAVPVEQAILLKDWNKDANLFITEGDHVFDRKHPWTKNSLPQNMQQVLDETIVFFNKSLST
jgi:uncharacterized protein